MTETNNTCTWYEIDGNTARHFASDCENDHVFSNPGVYATFVYCPYCGRKIEWMLTDKVDE